MAGAKPPPDGGEAFGSAASLYMGYIAQQALDLTQFRSHRHRNSLQQDFPQNRIGALRTLAGAFPVFSGGRRRLKRSAHSPVAKKNSRMAIARMLFNKPAELSVLDETDEATWNALRPTEGNAGGRHLESIL